MRCSFDRNRESATIRTRDTTECRKSAPITRQAKTCSNCQGKLKANEQMRVTNSVVKYPKLKKC